MLEADHLDSVVTACFNPFLCHFLFTQLLFLYLKAFAEESCTLQTEAKLSHIFDFGLKAGLVSDFAF